MSSSTPWDEARKRLSVKRGQTKHAASEAEGAREGGTLQINSGRFWHSKRDWAKFGYLFENRQTDSKTITINAVELGKIVRESMFEHKLPAMRLDFSKYNEDWVLVRRADFEEQNRLIIELMSLADELRKITE